MFSGLLLIAVGVVSGQLAKFLDYAMDYGQALDFVRYRMALKYGDDKQKQQLAGAIAQVDFANRLRTVNDIYWLIAAKRKPFVILMCVVCLSMYLWFPLYVATALLSGCGLKMALWCYLPSAIVNYTIAKHADL
jgi:hypothetical protein